MINMTDNIFVLNQDEVMAILGANHGNPHHILGMHPCLNDVYVNAFIPDASEVYVVDMETNAEYPMHAEYTDEFFTVKIENMEPFPYKLKIVKKVWNEDGEEDDLVSIVRDTYSFGYSVDLEKVMMVVNGQDDLESGFKAKELFGARSMTLDGVKGIAFCINVPGSTRVSVVGDFNNWDGRVHPMRKIDYTDIYELFIPYEGKDTRYKFEVLYESGNVDIFSDPYATSFEPYPGNASLLTKLSYEWHDGSYMEERRKKVISDLPVNIYEVHMPTWKSGKDGKALSYKEFGREIATYTKSMGYNYIELLPLMEYEDETTWGYDTVGMYAPTSRFGTPVDFMAMVDYLHSKGIGVIMDMVPIIDLDCMAYWIGTYHLDGIRLDNKELINSFKKVLGDEFPDIICDYTWNRAGVQKLVDYMREAPDKRQSFKGYVSACNELILESKEMLALCHDEVAYNMGSFIEKMPGGYEDKYADLRIFYGLCMAFSGKKLICMGQELGIFGGFTGNNVIDWSMLDFDANKYIQKYVKDLNALYLSEPALYNGRMSFEDTDEERIACIKRVCDDETLYILCNFSTGDCKSYTLSTDTFGTYKEIFSSDAAKYGGEGNNNKQQKTTKDGELEITVPALSFSVIKKIK